MKHPNPIGTGLATEAACGSCWSWLYRSWPDHTHSFIRSPSLPPLSHLTNPSSLSKIPSSLQWWSANVVRLPSYIVSCTKFPFVGNVSAFQSIKFVWFVHTLNG
uniref:Uncharacterized protein n=1 Tax=Salix viminalis TaxID=40686 RepID=A0A6N2KCW4_SALVM